MVVHYAGMVANLNEFYNIRDKYNIPIIEDCAHAFASEYKDKKLGYYSDFAIYSFQAIKHLTTIDGGLLIIKKSSDYNRGKKLRWFGLDKTIPRLQNDITEAGFKYHMNDVNATFGLIQLNFLKENVNKYIENGYSFDQELKDIDGIEIIKYHDTKPSYWLYTAIVDRRDDFIEYMKSNDVMCTPLHLRNDRHSIFEDGFNLIKLESFYSRFIHWGCGWWLSQDDRIKIVDLIKKDGSMIQFINHTCRDITSEIEDILYSGKLSYGDKEKSLKKNWHHTLEMIKVLTITYNQLC